MTRMVTVITVDGKERTYYPTHTPLIAQGERATDYLWNTKEGTFCLTLTHANVAIVEHYGLEKDHSEDVRMRLDEVASPDYIG